MTEVAVEGGQPDHDDDRREHQPGDRREGTRNAGETRADADRHVADVWARQELAQGEDVDHLLFREPLALLDDHPTRPWHSRAKAEEAGGAEAEEQVERCNTPRRMLAGRRGAPHPLW